MRKLSIFVSMLFIASSLTLVNATASTKQALLKPHPVVGTYGITWGNIVEEVNDISAAAWTDAQNTLIRNQKLPGIYKGFVSYISPGALKTDPQIGDAVTLIKRELVLYANVPRAKKVYFIATTQEEQAATQSKIKKSDPVALTPLTRSLNSIYGIEETGGSASGAPWIHPKCEGASGLRNSFSQPTNDHPSIVAAVVTISVCPTDANQRLEGIHGAAHEYIHTIQVALHPGGYIKGYQPCWMTEGETEWSQAVVSNDFDTYLTRTHYAPYYLTQSGKNYRESTQKVWAPKDVETYLKSAKNPATCGDTELYALAYSLGAATTEALVSIGGSESLFALDMRLSQGQKMNKAFKDIYGITWDAAIPILSKVVAVKITKAMSEDALTYQTKP